MYTLTIHVAPRDTIYKEGGTGAPHPSFGGHMWYSISSPTETLSRGFGPINNPTFPDIKKEKQEKQGQGKTGSGLSI
jgi:hypothetical protein